MAWHIYNGPFCRSVSQYWDHIAKFLDWRDHFMQTWMNMGLDAIICPVSATPAFKLELAHLCSQSGVYCQMYNSLNYACGTVPVTTVTKDDVQHTFDEKIHKPTNQMEKLLMKNVQGMEGLPVGVQCVALPFREEMCLRVMRELDRALMK